jgi:hypothetical protein
MKAVIIEKPGLYKVREVPDPVCPEGGLLINVLGMRFMWLRPAHPPFGAPPGQASLHHRSRGERKGD